MDRIGKPALTFCVTATLAAALLASLASSAGAQRPNRLVYNPLTGETEMERRRPAEPQAAPQVFHESLTEIIQPASHFEPCSGCGDAYCAGDCVGCGDVGYGVGCGDAAFCDTGCGSAIGCDTCPTLARFYAGFEATFVKPRFENNVAFTVMEADGASFESFTDTEFDYDLEMTPRVFLGWRQQDGVGMRVTWWQFDHEAATSSASPPANGFGQITHPTFGSVDISSTIPTDSFSAAADLNAYTIDLEATKDTCFNGWDLGVAGGIRYAYSEQSYQAQLRDTNGTLRGQINYRQSLEGFGPTISLSAARPILPQVKLFCKARGSVLFGDGKSRLVAQEDSDLTTPFNTTRTTNRDDLLSIGEIQLGFRWQAAEYCRQPYRPFLSAALEGQVWNGGGNATSEEGSLGFFGFNAGWGVDW